MFFWALLWFSQQTKNKKAHNKNINSSPDVLLIVGLICITILSVIAAVVACIACFMVKKESAVDEKQSFLSSQPTRFNNNAQISPGFPIPMFQTSPAFIPVGQNQFQFPTQQMQFYQQTPYFQSPQMNNVQSEQSTIEAPQNIE